MLAAKRRNQNQERYVFYCKSNILCFGAESGSPSFGLFSLE